MRKTILRCGACGAALQPPATAGAGSLGCAQCGGRSRAWLFPALFRAGGTARAQPLLDEGQSSCMNHPGKRASTVCDGCGKFLCALCDIGWDGEHLCTDCIAHRRDADHEGTMRTEYVHYDMVALFLATISIPAMALGALFAPVALYLAWRHWNTPWRPVPYRKWTMAAASMLAISVITVWIGFFTYMIVNL